MNGKHGLLIAEKASARRDIEAIYNRNRTHIPFTLDFEQFHGHVVRLKMPEEIRTEWTEWEVKTLPMVPDEPEWEYVPEEDPKRYNAVKKAIQSGRYDFIINAGDYEREGQLIQDAFFSTLDITIPIYRLWGNTLTEKDVVEGLNHLLDYNDTIPRLGTVENLSKAAFIRSRMDWLVGLNSTRALTLRGGTTIRSGRVKLPILKILADREMSIQNFKIEPFWTIRAQFETEAGECYEGTLVDSETKKNQQFKNKSEAEAIEVSDTGIITSVDQKTIRENPPLLYSMASIQSEASDVFGIKMEETDKALQNLYEQKITSYPRTESAAIAESEVDDFLSGFQSLHSIPELRDIPRPTKEQEQRFAKNSRYVNDKKVKSHSALMVLPGAPIKFDALSDTEQKILFLIGRSMLLSMMDPVVKEKTELLTQVGDHLFKTNGTITTDPGWSAYAKEYSQKEQSLPTVKEEDMVNVASTELKEGKTTPPSRYSVKTLLSVLENIHRLVENDEEKLAIKEAEGLGRPSTRTSILSELEKNEYIYTKGKKQEYYVTEFGVSLIESVGHTRLASPELSAHFETQLQKIEEGSRDADSVYQEILTYTDEMTQELLSTSINLKNAPSKASKIVYESEDGYTVYEAKSGYYDDIFKEWMSKGQQGEREGLWINKKIHSKKLKMKGSITNKDVNALLSGKTIKKTFKFEDGSESQKELILKSGGVAFIGKATDVEVDEFFLQGEPVKLVSGVKNGKEFAFYKLAGGQTVGEVSFGYHITRDDLDLLIQGETIERPLISKKGKTYQGLLTLGKERLELSFPEREKNYLIDEEGFKVQLIEGENKRGKYSFYKVNNEWTVPTIMSQQVITEEDVRILHETGQLFKSDWISKKGEPFSANLIRVGDRVQFDFG